MFLDPPMPSFVVNSDTGEREPTGYLQKKEGILYAEVDLEDSIEGK
jgi:hypothetical protein